MVVWLVVGKKVVWREEKKKKKRNGGMECVFARRGYMVGRIDNESIEKMAVQGQSLINRLGREGGDGRIGLQALAFHPCDVAAENGLSRTR